MHPTAAALCLAGYRLWQYKGGKGDYLCFVAGWHDESWGYLNHSAAFRPRPSDGWRMRNSGSPVGRALHYKEIDWTRIPDSVWAQCNLNDAVEVLEDRLPF